MRTGAKISSASAGRLAGERSSPLHLVFTEFDAGPDAFEQVWGLIAAAGGRLDRLQTGRTRSAIHLRVQIAALGDAGASELARSLISLAVVRLAWVQKLSHSLGPAEALG